MKLAILWAQCNECLSTTQMACVSETQYQMCINNLPSGPVNSCPSGYICSTTTSVICQPTTSGFPASCGGCNVCNADLVFACTGTNTYALCLNTTIPSTTATGSCGTNFVCNTNLPEICGNPTSGVSCGVQPMPLLEFIIFKSLLYRLSPLALQLGAAQHLRPPGLIPYLQHLHCRQLLNVYANSPELMLVSLCRWNLIRPVRSEYKNCVPARKSTWIQYGIISSFMVST